MEILRDFLKGNNDLKIKYPCNCDIKYYQTKMIKLYVAYDKTNMKNAQKYLNDPLLKGVVDATSSYVSSAISWIPGAHTLAKITWSASEGYLFPPVYRIVFDCNCRKCKKCFSLYAQCIEGQKSLGLINDEDIGKLEDIMNRKYDFKLVLKRYEKMPSLKSSEEWAKIAYGQFK